MNVEFIARITCACGKAVEVEAYNNRDVDETQCDAPMGWSGG